MSEINFEKIREAYYNEKNESNLALISEDFFENALKYVKEKEEAYEKTKDERILNELKNARRMIDEILNERLKKIISSAAIFLKSGILPNNLTKKEEELFFKVIDFMKEYKKEMLKISKVKLKIIKDVPKIVLENKDIGPFKKDETIEVEKEIAKILIEAGYAKEI